MSAETIPSRDGVFVDQSIDQALPATSAETVPFHQADLEPIHAQFKLATFRLKNGSTVGVGIFNGGPDLAIKLTRPTRDGNTAELLFGLFRESAIALLILLGETLAPASPEKTPQ